MSISVQLNWYIYGYYYMQSSNRIGQGSQGYHSSADTTLTYGYIVGEYTMYDIAI